ncbi:MAG: phage tail family protein [Methanobrevibacter sp.]|nr:phage tail family protein [Methanobrevibacter sp.]
MQKLIWQNSKGEEINLTSGHYGITNWQGFSEVSSNVQSQTVPFQDGSVYLDALLDERELSVTLAIQDNNDLELRYQLRRELIHALNPKLGEGYLIYSNDFISKRIKCVANVPVFENHNSNDTGTPKASLTWTACEPYWEDLEEQEKFFAVGEIAEIENNGDIPCQVQVEFFGTSQKAQIDNLTTEKKLEVDTTIGDGIVINTNVGQKSALRENLKFDVVDSANEKYGICYSSELNLFATVGTNGEIQISKDGVNWETYNVGNNYDLNSICYSSELNLFVAVGNQIVISSDGKEWTIVNISNPYLKNICYSSELNLFVAVGQNGTILTSSDGLNWTSQTSGISSLLNSICYSDDLNLFIAVGASGIILTSSDGINWTSQISNVTQNLYSIIYGYNKFVAVGASGTILTSSDGVSWTSRSGAESYTMKEIIYSKDLELFIAIAGTNNIISKDGITWNVQLLGSYGTNAICYSSELNLLVMVGYGSENIYIFTSLDGINWNVNTKPIISLGGICYSSELNLFVAVGFKSGFTTATIILTSSDGLNWTSQISGTNKALQAICYSSELNLFVAVGASGTILTSSDGISWTSQISEVSVQLNSIVYSKELNRFVIVGNTGTILISSNGINWSSVTSGVSTNLRTLIYSSKLNLFVAVGASGIILTSSDGLNWTSQISGVTDTIQSITYSSELNLFVAVGLDALISKDGVNWNKYTMSGLSYGICYSSELNLFVAVGQNGLIYISSDGKEWTQKPRNAYINLLSISYSDDLNLFVAVGRDGTIINSDFEQAENIIQNLTEDSDMNFNLEVGENKLRLVRDNGSLTSRIIYRQKYIGV